MGILTHNQAFAKANFCKCLKMDENKTKSENCFYRLIETYTIIHKNYLTDTSHNKIYYLRVRLHNDQTAYKIGVTDRDIETRMKELESEFKLEIQNCVCVEHKYAKSIEDLIKEKYKEKLNALPNAEEISTEDFLGCFKY